MSDPPGSWAQCCPTTCKDTFLDMLVAAMWEWDSVILVTGCLFPRGWSCGSCSQPGVGHSAYLERMLLLRPVIPSTDCCVQTLPWCVMMGRVSQLDCQDGTGEAGGLCIFAIIGEEHSCSAIFLPLQKQALLKGNYKPVYKKWGYGLLPSH